MEEDDMEMELELETVTLTDDSGRTIACTIEHAIEVEGEDYVLLLPVDSPIEIFAWQEEGEEEEAIPVEDEEDLDQLFTVAKAVLEEQNLTLKRTAVTLTVEGELPDPEEEEDGLEVGGEDQEELQFLASFYYEEQEFGVYTPLDPFFILARMDANNQPQLLSPEELEKIEPMLPLIEDQLLDQFE